MALKICSSVVDKEIGNLMLGIMRETTFSKRSLHEQQQFEQLNSYPFPTTFQFLSEILKDKNITRNKVVTAKQLWVVDVFAKIGTDDARSILQGLKGNWFFTGRSETTNKKRSCEMENAKTYKRLRQI